MSSLNIQSPKSKSICTNSYDFWNNTLLAYFLQNLRFWLLLQISIILLHNKLMKLKTNNKTCLQSSLNNIQFKWCNLISCVAHSWTKKKTFFYFFFFFSLHLFFFLILADLSFSLSFIMRNTSYSFHIKVKKSLKNLKIFKYP